ncbi:MAG: undecaprenyldiphospho-muramoylpentapeptide beta-N-acetylglucosaminyltransferase [candidate division Zixibacteria bacterium]|nr:undecaprenyldiphospho-muramoylpentapeptide beta-N-acetylglucosaminyltransferase [candidate division Zixibacteria bacterium]
MTALQQTTRLVFAGGGTGGHLFPAIAIADRVKEMLVGKTEVDISFVGTTRGIEFRMRDQLGYPLHLVNIRGIVRSLTLKNLLVPFLTIGSLIRSYRLLKALSPHVVVGTGGYVSWPVLRAATFMGIPTVLQEQNSFPGIVTRQRASAAERVYLGFAQARSFLPEGTQTMLTGNPVRRTIADGDRATACRRYNLAQNAKTILILGGSQGARAINTAVTKSIQSGGVPDGYQILWQTGKRDYKEVVATFGPKTERVSLFPFAKNMAQVYAAADLAVARAGALTLAELEACSVPAILIPYPFAAGDHQRKNAEASVANGAALLIDEKNLAEKDILAEAVALGNGPAVAMTRTMRQAQADRKPAVDMIAEDIITLIAQRQEAAVGG